jgi:hypothetical protein
LDIGLVFGLVNGFFPNVGRDGLVAVVDFGLTRADFVIGLFILLRDIISDLIIDLPNDFAG